MRELRTVMGVLCLLLMPITTWADLQISVPKDVVAPKNIFIQGVGQFYLHNGRINLKDGVCQ